jgi:CBS domain-containing protein
MRVNQVMTKEVKACRGWDSLNTAAQIMWDRDCGCVPVLDESSKVVAVITDRDVCMAAYTRGKALHEMQVKSAMSERLWSCTPNDTLAIAEKTMQAHRVHRLPVIDGEGRLVGIVSLSDLAREAIRQRSAMGRGVTDDEIGRTLAKICETCPPSPTSAPAPAEAPVRG